MTGAATIIVGDSGFTLSRHEVERIASISGTCIATVQALYSECPVPPRAALAIGKAALMLGVWVPRRSIATRGWPRREKAPPSLSVQVPDQGGPGIGRPGASAGVSAGHHDEVA